MRVLIDLLIPTNLAICKGIAPSRSGSRCLWILVQTMVANVQAPRFFPWACTDGERSRISAHLKC